VKLEQELEDSRLDRVRSNPLPLAAAVVLFMIAFRLARRRWRG
jgi:hypothetical protein